jgi:uncharacterized membrane protein YheB (UPF0754 family)
MSKILSDPELWKYLSIPFVAAVVGWATNWVAIRMTFRPLEFRGLPPFLGWQGIIPSKAGKMAAIFVDSTMHRLGTFAEAFRRMEPDKMAAQVKRVLEPRLDRYTDDVLLLGRQSLVWRNLPAVVREAVYERVRSELPGLVDDIIAEITDRVEELVDFKHMLVDQLTTDKRLLNRLFLEAGAAEFRFIVRSGLYFGFLFGLVQLTVWWFYKGWWVLPVFGLLVGYSTNWIALNIIFRPLNPTRLGPWTIQGLFLRRQREVAQTWCRLVTHEILTLRRIVHAMLHGPRCERTRQLIHRQVKPLADEALGLMRPAAGLALKSGELEEIKRLIGEKAVAVSQEPFDDWIFTGERADALEEMLRERMEALPPEQFQDLLRPCFQEDEMKLILVGAALGFVAGLAQLFLVFGGPG